MANTGTSTPQKLSLPQQTQIHQENPPVGKALQTIVDYVNSNVTPVQGNRKAPRKNAPGSI